MARLQEDQRRLQIRLARSFRKTRGNCERNSFSRTSTTIATFSSASVAARSQLRHRRNELCWQVVDAEVAEVFERPDRLRLPGPGESGQDDESPRAARPRQDGFRRHTCPPCSTSSSESASV